ncbi:hypothetical protein AK812_SmicGene2899 [Symbiodinium microadriaticum]|uniref:Uncharacterized protein n=1 Tax=Symbiodinium microadriaticum TaxID=2951 RepID=A0A1Q9F0E7_SYMMI|nr:hypothetical protein AK812_SmicGene2899 [Symbiodinium microadriaticum]CAE7415195.1 unnamed protein product [Symbiodinium microadriaticum]CAE7698861.1 unnamed protein product [Symbiodinium sp. KB8]
MTTMMWVRWLLYLCVPCCVVCTDQMLFWVDDLISQNKVESKLWMMTGEDASLGTRKIQYDDFAYCLEAHGTLDGSVCKPSYLINGWNSTDGTSLAVRTSISVAYDPAGEGDGEHVVGPVADKTNRRIYWITPSCATSSGRRLTVWKVKYLLDNQITPDGSDPNPLTCENESYVYAVNRYDVDTQKYSLIYAAARADFPAPEKWTAYSWKLAFDETRQRLYWWFYAGACAVVRTCDAPLYYIDVSGLSDDGAMPTPVSAANITDGYGHAYWDMTIDNDGNLYLVDWYKIRKYDVTTGAVTDLHTEDYLNTGYHFTGVTHWTGTNKLIVTKTTSVTSELWTFDTSDSTWAQLYSAVYYEFYDLGQTIYNTAVDVTHGLLYVATSGGNSGGRSIIELPLAPSGQTAPYKACATGRYNMDCPLYGIGERLVVGHMYAAFSVAGSGKATNFAAGSADRFPAWGTSQIALLPASGTYPTRNPCFGNTPATIDTLSTKLKATTRTRCGKDETSGFDTRHIIFSIDAGDKAPSYLLRDYISMEGLARSADGGWGYDYIGQRRAYDHYQELATGGGNDGVIPGIKSPWGYGVAVKGPAVDLIHGYVYWMSCERSALPGVCSEHALKRVPISVLETAAKMPDPVDCKVSSCPHSGSTQVLDDRYAVIEAAVEVLYHQSTQLFPGNDDTVPNQVKLAIDPEAEIVYWFSPQPSTGYVSLLYLDVQGWTPSQGVFEPCDVGEVAGHYAYGSWSSLVVACDGTLLSHEVNAIKALNFANDTHVAACKAQAALWPTLDPDGRTGWKGCWDRIMDTGTASATGANVLKAMTYDPKRDQVYYAFRHTTTTESISRFLRTAGPQGPGNDEVVYSGIFYEFPPRSDKGAAFIAGLALDTLNEQIYVANYYGNSAKQSLAMLPLPENKFYPGENKVVHAKYWPMDLVAEDDAPIACLYGHQSIEHSSGYGNRKCEYQGERLQWTLRHTGMDVILPNPEGITRFYVTDTSNNLAVLPPKPVLLGRSAPFNWTQFFYMLPHAKIGTSKTNGWTFLSMPVTATDLGYQPSFDLCAELCSTFWRNGTQRCVAFDWRMSNHDCEFLKDQGRLPNHTKSCAYSNSGLSCLFALVPLTDSADSFSMWPNPCFTMPTADSDGNAWIIAESGYAPAGGWPSYVREGYSFDKERSLTFFLRPELLEETAEAQAMRDMWRQAVPNARWYGTSQEKEYTVGDYARNGNAIFPGDLQAEIFKNRVQGVDPDDTNPPAMPTTAASCFASDVVATTTAATGGETGGTSDPGGDGVSSTSTTGSSDDGTSSPVLGGTADKTIGLGSPMLLLSVIFMNT